MITHLMSLPPGSCSFPGGSQSLTHSPLQHISSRRHRDGVAGKPNPLLSRHKKPRGAAELAVRRWGLQHSELGNRCREKKGPPGKGGVYWAKQ